MKVCENKLPIITAIYKFTVILETPPKFAMVNLVLYRSLYNIILRRVRVTIVNVGKQ
jgi:hypothetical protein